MTTAISLPPAVERSAIAKHPDTDRYKCRFDIPSESSDSIHRVSFDAAPNAGYWTCSCMGNRRYGQCKHLSAMGLPGRKFGRSLEWLKKLQLG